MDYTAGMEALEKREYFHLLRASNHNLSVAQAPTKSLHCSAHYTPMHASLYCNKEIYGT
jgi:hypothetical protein